MKKRLGGMGAIAWLAAGVLGAQADGTPITFGVYRTIHSEVLGEDRTLLVHLPGDYAKSGMRYPVLYKLDGEMSNFVQALSAANYLFDWTDKAPEPIIVGIVNTDRGRDMSLDQRPDNFIQFLKAELIPFIDKNYRTNRFRTLCGQSASSVLAGYSFLKQPSLFDAYVLSSFGLFNESYATRYNSELKRQDWKAVGQRYLFVANGKRDSYDADGSTTIRGAKFLDSLRSAAPATVLIETRDYDDEGHVPFPAIYDGLKWIYSREKALAQAADYLGQKPPGDTPIVFAPGTVSNGHVHSRLAISPDGSAMCWTSVPTLTGQGVPRIVCAARENGIWTKPQTPPFADQAMTANPLFSPDGTKLFFDYTNAREKGWSTRYVTKTDSGWSVPRSDGFLLSTSSSFTNSGKVYFTGGLKGKPWNMGTYSARYSGDGYSSANALDASINTPYIDYTPFISSDESFLMFSSSRPSMEEQMFLQISFRNADGTWPPPRKMNGAIGFVGQARFPSISPDGKYLFFCGDDGNIYWVSSEVIQRLAAASPASRKSSFQGLGDLPGGTFESAALRVSADGSVVVGNGTTTSGKQAFCWTQSEGMAGLGNLPDGSFKQSWAEGVSADGSAIVGYGDPDPLTLRLTVR